MNLIIVRRGNRVTQKTTYTNLADAHLNVISKEKSCSSAAGNSCEKIALVVTKYSLFISYRQAFLQKKPLQPQTMFARCLICR